MSPRRLRGQHTVDTASSFPPIATVATVGGGSTASPEPSHASSPRPHTVPAPRDGCCRRSWCGMAVVAGWLLATFSGKLRAWSGVAIPCCGQPPSYGSSCPSKPKAAGGSKLASSTWATSMACRGFSVPPQNWPRANFFRSYSRPVQQGHSFKHVSSSSGHTLDT